MARKMTEWPSKRGPITKIMPSDGCIGDTVPLAVGKWYDFHEFGWYMGNVGNSMSSDAMGPYASFTPIAIALLIMLVLLIVYYKFNSHNRYAGYCKLLNEESWNIPSELNEDVYTWEICIDRLIPVSL